MNRNWMTLVAGLLLTLTACNTDGCRRGTVAYNPQQRTGEVAPEKLFSSMEVITLQCPDEVIVDTGNDLLFDAGIFYLVDRAHRKSVDLFDRQGGYIGSVQAFGRSGAEYAGISGVQPVDLLVAVYSYHNQALYCYDRQGRFVRRDSLAYGPLDLLKVSDGYWGYAGYSNTVPSRVVRMDPQGTITREYLPTANIIPCRRRAPYSCRTTGIFSFARYCSAESSGSMRQANSRPSLRSTSDAGTSPTPTSRATTRCRPHRSS